MGPLVAVRKHPGGFVEDGHVDWPEGDRHPLPIHRFDRSRHRLADGDIKTSSCLGESRNRPAEIRADSLAKPTLELTEVRTHGLNRSTTCLDARSPDTSVSVTLRPKGSSKGNGAPCSASAGATGDRRQIAWLPGSEWPRRTLLRYLAASLFRPARYIRCGRSVEQAAASRRSLAASSTATPSVSPTVLPARAFWRRTRTRSDSACARSLRTVCLRLRSILAIPSRFAPRPGRSGCRSRHSPQTRG